MRDPGPALLVAFDGGCPACRREIAHYRRLWPLRPLQFVDLSEATLPADWPARDALLARLHARLPDGRWCSGAAAFVAVWDRLPGWRWLGRAARLPGAMTALEIAYRGFLRIRPLWRRPALCELRR